MPIPEIAGKLRFNKRQIIEGMVIQGQTPLDMSSFPSAKLVYISCVRGSGSVKYNGGYPEAITAPGVRAFFNYTGGIRSVEFNGDGVVDILLFQ